MATKTYYAKLDCRQNTGNADLTFNEEYYNLTNFLTYLSSSNKCTLVSWNSGSAAAGSGDFSTKTYWDGANPFGVGTHSIWKFHTSSLRNWEWYMYVQAVTGSATINQAHNSPIQHVYSSNNSSTAIGGVVAGRGIVVQTAVCVSGTTSFNPWNGTISQGNSTAGSPRWASGSNDRYMFVLPRANDAGGTYSSLKQACHSFGSYLSSATRATSRQHFIYDGDALLYISEHNDVGVSDVNYFGAFELRNSLTASGIGGSDYGFCMMEFIDGNNSTQNPDTIPLNTVIGTTTGMTNYVGGGAAVPVGNAISGSKGIIAVSPGSSFFSRTYQPNSVTGKYDQFPVCIGFAESPHLGLLGNLNSGLIKYVVGPEVNQVTADYRSAVFGGATAITNLKVTVPWTGSFAPGTSLSRTGSLFTWTYDYG